MNLDIEIKINPKKKSDYERFIECKKLPRYRVIGSSIFTDNVSFNLVFGGENQSKIQISDNALFDYQQHIVNIALERKRFAAFLDCGLGKTIMQLKWAEAICAQLGKCLILCPLSVVQEFYNDAKKFNINIPISNLRKGEKWESGIGILNFESMRDIDISGVFGVSLDESSILKNGDGATKKWIVSLCKTIPYKLACSATPAPNEQSEYASHSVFLDVCSTEKEFYARFFRKEGNKWILKGHAESRFYEFLSTWACYIYNPSLLGFECGGFLSSPPEYNQIDCKGGDNFIKGKLFSDNIGLSGAQKIYKYRAEKGTDRFKKCVEYATKYKSIVWCIRNAEEKAYKESIPNSALITGATKIDKRIEIINAFRNGDINTIISKPKILGWGVNLQQAQAHIYSGYDFSFESFYQAIRRSHRYGRLGALKVFIPMIEAEKPIYSVLQKKIKTFEYDVVKLQSMFTALR